MDNQLVTIKRDPALKRWYDYNKQSIPLYFVLIGAFFFTAFLDFEIQGTGIILESHIAAIRKFLNTPQNNLSAFYLFAMYLIALIQIFNASSFAKKRSPFSTILINILAILQAIIAVLYTAIFFNEQASRTDYVIDSVARLAYSVSLIGAAFFLVGAALTWLYTNWKYVREVD
jgi:hypothetical protein